MVFQSTFERWSESSTIHGVRYASDGKSAYYHRFLWIAVTLSASFMGIYMSCQMYLDWKEQVSTIRLETIIPIHTVSQNIMIQNIQRCTKRCAKHS